MSGLHVVFRVGAADYVLPASEVLHMETFAGATPVPGTAPYVAGILQLRGRVLPVVDLRVRFGLPAAERTMDSRVVVVEASDRTLALLVDSAREVVQLADEQLKPPPHLAAGEAGFVKAVAQLDGRLLMLIDVAEVGGEEGSHGDE